MRFDDFERRARQMFDSIPDEYRHGVSYLVVSKETVPHPEVPGVFILGECATGEYDLGLDAPGETRSGVHLYHGSFRALARQEEGFDWEGELWETLAHEVLHHRESMAGEDALEEMDYAEDENFKRREGQTFDPFFYRAGEPVGERTWEVDGDRFIEREMDPAAFERTAEIVVEIEGEPMAVPRPAVLGDVHYMYLEGVFGDDDDAGEVVLVLVRRRGAWESMRSLFGRRPPEVFDSAVRFEDPAPGEPALPGSPPGEVRRLGPEPRRGALVRIVELRTYAHEMEAEIARDILEAEGIPAEVRGEGGSGGYGPVLGALRGYRLMVREDDAAEAHALLAEPGGDLPPTPPQVEEAPREE